jgi:hypothetical protein
VNRRACGVAVAAVGGRAAGCAGRAIAAPLGKERGQSTLSP